MSAFYVELENLSYVTAMLALANAMVDKFPLCQSLGYDIEPEDWPSIGLNAVSCLIIKLNIWIKPCYEGTYAAVPLLVSEFRDRKAALSTLKPKVVKNDSWHA